MRAGTVMFGRKTRTDQDTVLLSQLLVQGSQIGSSAAVGLQSTPEHSTETARQAELYLGTLLVNMEGCLDGSLSQPLIHHLVRPEHETRALTRELWLHCTFMAPSIARGMSGQLSTKSKARTHRRCSRSRPRRPLRAEGGWSTPGYRWC
jgi:hypothetical protein